MTMKPLTLYSATLRSSQRMKGARIAWSACCTSDAKPCFRYSRLMDPIPTWSDWPVCRAVGPAAAQYPCLHAVAGRCLWPHCGGRHCPHLHVPLTGWHGYLWLGPFSKMTQTNHHQLIWILSTVRMNTLANNCTYNNTLHASGLIYPNSS